MKKIAEFFKSIPTYGFIDYSRLIIAFFRFILGLIFILFVAYCGMKVKNFFSEAHKRVEAEKAMSEQSSFGIKENALSKLQLDENIQLKLTEAQTVYNIKKIESLIILGLIIKHSDDSNKFNMAKVNYEINSMNDLIKEQKHVNLKHWMPHADSVINCNESNEDCSQTIMWLVKNNYEDKSNHIVQNVYNNFMKRKQHAFLKELEIHSPEVFNKLMKD